MPDFCEKLLQIGNVRALLRSMAKKTDEAAELLKYELMNEDLCEMLKEVESNLAAVNDFMEVRMKK